LQQIVALTLAASCLQLRQYFGSVKEGATQKLPQVSSEASTWQAVTAVTGSLNLTVPSGCDCKQPVHETDDAVSIGPLLMRQPRVIATTIFPMLATHAFGNSSDPQSLIAISLAAAAAVATWSWNP
jgi:hypothetical protein